MKLLFSSLLILQQIFWGIPIEEVPENQNHSSISPKEVSVDKKANSPNEIKPHPGVTFTHPASKVFTGSTTTMQYGRFGLESVHEVNALGHETRTETYTYHTDSSGKLTEYSYNIRDENPTSIETSKGTKVIASGAKQSLYEASGTVKFDSKGRVTFSEENKTLKQGGKTTYSFHDKMTDVQYDRLNQMVSFNRQISEKGLGVKKYSTTITRTGTVDSDGKLNYYKERQVTKVKGAKITDVYEARPSYEGDKLINENRELTYHKVKQTGGFFAKILSFLPALLVFIPGFQALGFIAQTLWTAAANAAVSLIGGLVSGQGFGHALLGAFISFGVSIVAAGVSKVANNLFHGLPAFSGMISASETMNQAGAMSIASMGAGNTLGVAGAQGLEQTFTATSNALYAVSQSVTQSVAKQIFTKGIMMAVGDKLGPVGSSILGGVLGGLTGDPGKIVQNVLLGAVKGTASGFISQALGNSTLAQFANAAIGGITDAAIDRIGIEIISGLDKMAYNWKARSAIPDGGEAIVNENGYIIGSETHKNGATNIYDVKGNFVQGLPDNQIPVYGPDGKLQATVLPVAVATNGLAPNIFFSPITQDGQSPKVLGYVPAGAEPVILSDSEGSPHLIGSFLSSQDGTLTDYDKRGLESYTISRDGTITFNNIDGSKAQSIPGTVEISNSSNGGYFLEDKATGKYLQIDQNWKTIASGDNLGNETFFGKDGNPEFTFLANAELGVNASGQEVQRRLDLDGTRMFNLQGNQIQYIPDGAREEILNGNLVSYRETTSAEGIIRQEWFDPQGNKVPLQEISNLYQSIYETGKNTILGTITNGASVASSILRQLPIATDIYSLWKRSQLGPDQGGWLSYLNLGNLLGKVSFMDPQPALATRMGERDFFLKSIPGYIFGDRESEVGVAYPSPWVKWNNTKYVFTLGLGVGNTAQSTLVEAKRLADKVGQPVLYVVNPTQGILNDLAQSAAEKFISIPDATMAASFNLHTGILEKAPPGVEIIDISHSQKGIITTNEAEYLSKDERDRINYIALATAAYRGPEFKSTDPYINTLDFVGHFLGQGVVKTGANVAYFPIASIFGDTSDYQFVEYTPGYGWGHSFRSYDESLNEALDKLSYPRNREEK